MKNAFIIATEQYSIYNCNIKITMIDKMLQANCALLLEVNWWMLESTHITQNTFEAYKGLTLLDIKFLTRYHYQIPNQESREKYPNIPKEVQLEFKTVGIKSDQWTQT